ncbi:MAG: hypothetical protein J5645_08430 [Lachnospiraceae bacterium]|nr:hypothetical protein [Lachnospiraceae bacterium]
MRSIWAATILGVASVAAVITGFAFAARIPAEERFAGQKRLLYAGYLVALGKRWLMRKLRLDGAEESYYRAMYVNDRPGAKRTEADCRLGIFFVALALGLSAVVLWSAFSGGFAATALHQIDRPEEGTGIAKVIARYRGGEFELSMAVTEKQMTSEELLASAAEAEEQMVSWILGENPGVDCVSKPLTFPERIPGTPIAVSWSTSDYRIIDYSGNVHPELCGENGEPVVLTATLTYGDWEEIMQIPVLVCRVGEAADVDRRTLEEMLEKVSKDQAYENEIRLPEQWEGEQVEFYEERRYSPWMFAAYAVLLGIVGILVGVSSRKKLRKERENQLLRDYPDVVSKMTLLMEAGSTIRLAWERIVDDYVRHRGRRSEREYVYEEMLHARNRLSVGVSEEVAYEEFGRRCGNIRYLRLSSVLVQNLKKGSAGVLPLLRKEAAEAFCDRREQAKQRGEEAGTKLLLPMAGILIIILAMILIPAFMSL